MEARPFHARLELVSQLGTAGRNPAYQRCMGVLSMAIPLADLDESRPARAASRAARSEKQLGLSRFAATGQGLPVGATRIEGGFSDARSKSRPVIEEHVQRTPEQEAAEKMVRQCLDGDAEAWCQLVTSHHRRIYAICYRFTGSGSDAEDLTQEVFLKIYRNLNSFDTSKGSFQTWITTLARNLLVDHFRRTRQDRATDSMDAGWEDDEDGPSRAERLADTHQQNQHDRVAALEIQARVQAGLKQLSPELREAVVLRDLEDMDYKEIALVLRIPEGTVKSRISRGRGELARILQRTQDQGRVM